MSYLHHVLRLAAIAAAFITVSLPLQAGAQGKWPERPVRLVVPFAPGASTDNVARMLALRPAPLVTRLSSELNAVLESADFRELLAREGATARAGTPESLGKLMRSELASWSRLIKAANIQMQ